MRRPEPWYWAARKGWYVQLNRKQIKLGDDAGPRCDKAGAPQPPAVVMREYYRLMAAEGVFGQADRQKMTCAEVCECFLAAKSQVQPGTHKAYTRYMQILCDHHGKKNTAAVRFDDVCEIAEGKAAWGEAGRHEFVSCVLLLMRWAKDAGYLELNPMAGRTNPYHKPRRVRVLTDGEFEAVLACSKDLQFKQILMFMRATACRPGEARKVTAAHVHPTRPLVILKPHEHKTGKRTGKDRVLLLAPAVETMVRTLASRYPTGPIFRNSRNGRGWCIGALPRRFRGYRERLGLGDDVVPYLVRHTTATNLLEAGVSAHLVAKIMGHAGTTTLQTTYYHPDVDRMVDAVAGAVKLDGKKVRPSGV